MKTNEYLYDRTDESASHFCAVCGAWWLCNADRTWTLRSPSAGEECCNNKPMHGNKNIVSARHAVMAASNIYSSPLKAALMHAEDKARSLASECEELRTEASRAWRELDAMARDRDRQAQWRKELADELHECEKIRDALGAKVNALDRVRAAYETLRSEAEEWECDGLGLWAQHGWWEAVDEELDKIDADRDGAATDLCERQPRSIR